MNFKRHLLVFSLVLLFPALAGGQNVKKWDARIVEYQAWLDQLRSDPYQFWTRLDGSRRPHRLYVGEGFYGAKHEEQERFIEIFSHTVAGHPEKFMLIDIFDSETEMPVGEFGWAGFKLNLPVVIPVPVSSNVN